MVGADKVYSTDEENFCFQDLGEVFDDLDCGGELEVGRTYYSADKVKPKASSFFNVGDLLVRLGECAGEEHGEYADDFPGLISKEKISEFANLIGGWLDANVAVTFYGVKNVQAHEVTQNDIDEVNA